MIDSEVRRLARDRIGPRMEERRRLLPRQIEVIKNDMTVRGFGSGARTQAIQEACEQEAAARVALSWAELKTVLAAVGVSFSEELAGELKVEVGRHVDSGDLVRTVNSAAGDDYRIRAAVDRALEMIGSDVALYAANLKRVAEQQGLTGQPIYNFLGPVGAFQTGSHAIANVVQNISPENREALLHTLGALGPAIGAARDLAAGRKAEILELVDESKREVAKERPNSLRLPSLLRDLATAVQTIPAAREAYGMLRALMATLGLGEGDQL